MATPMTASQVKAQLRKWGVPFKEYKDWEDHNRNHKGKWGPVNGFMVHHTGSDSTDQRSLLYYGTAELPGPLCHFGLAQDGTVWLIGWGRANHAGSGDPDVLDAVVAESYGKYPPADNQSTVDGNARFYGVEIWYSGSHSMTAAQYQSLMKLAAAVCDFHGWSEKSVIGHGEWGSPGKWDPGYAPGKMMDMADVRADIAATLKGKQVTVPDTPDKGADKPSASTPARYRVTIGGKVYGYGAYGDHVTKVGQALVKKGFGSYYKVGPGPRWTDADTRAYAAYQRSLGYSGKDADGVPGPATLKKLLGSTSVPTVSLKRLVSAAKSNPPAKGTPVTYAGVRTVEDALVREGLLSAARADGHFGSDTVKAYAAWQRRLGYRGQDADGIPGSASLKKLADRYGFRVTA